MSLSATAIDIVMRNCAAELERIKEQHFGAATKLTLVARVPGVDGAHVVVSADDLDEVIALLRKENGEP